MLEKCLLGNTDIAVSRVGLGTVKFGRNQEVRYPENFILPTDKEIQELLLCAQELGINLLDTAPAYGTSEERLGKLLKGARKDWILCTKVGEEFENNISRFDFSAQATRKSIERSLKRLATDYLDIVLVHSNGEDKRIIEEGIFETLIELKQAGLIRAFGMSTKTVEGGMMAVEQSDVVMLTYNPLHIEEKSVITQAYQKNKAVFIKKALLSGHIKKIAGENPVQTIMKFIFAEPGVTSVILGTINKKHLVENVRGNTIFHLPFSDNSPIA